MATVPVLGEITGAPGDTNAEITPTTAQTRAEVIFTLDQIKGKRVLVTAPAPGQGNNTAALTLASSFAEIGKKVILVDADYRSDVLANSGASLADYTAGCASLASIITPNYMGVTGLDGISAGKADVPTRILASQAMSGLIDALTAQYDYVVIAASEVGTYSETFALASLADLTLMTLRTGLATPAYIQSVNALAAAGRFPNLALIATEKQ